MRVTDSSSFTPIEVRHYAHSPTVAILAWETPQALYGLEALVRRDGSLIRDRHRLFVSAYYTAAPPLFTKAVTGAQVLRLTRIAEDPYWCIGGTPCLPPETFGALIPDSFLRSHPDSIPVMFYGDAGRTLPITLHGDLIRAYVSTIDSIVTVMHQKRS
jgi:hypothetical protein